jgi:hypothetical protein
VALLAPIFLSATRMTLTGLPAAGSAEPMPARNRGPGLRTKDVECGNPIGDLTRRQRNRSRLWAPGSRRLPVSDPGADRGDPGPCLTRRAGLPVDPILSDDNFIPIS